MSAIFRRDSDEQAQRFVLSYKICSIEEQAPLGIFSSFPPFFATASLSGRLLRGIVGSASAFAK